MMLARQRTNDPWKDRGGWRVGGKSAREYAIAINPNFRRPLKYRVTVKLAENSEI